MTFSFAHSASNDAISSSGVLPASLATALEHLQTEDFARRWDAAKVIQRHGDMAIAPLLSLLHATEEDDELTWFIVRTLGESEHLSTVPILIQILQTTDADDVRQAAATALARHPDTVLPLLEPLLETEQGRLHAVPVLAQMHHPDALFRLLPLATDPDPAVRTLVIEALSYSQDPCVLPILKQSLRDTVPAIRRATVAGLGSWKGDGLQQTLIPLMMPLLYDLNLDVRRQTILALGRLGTEAAIAPLNEALRSPHTPATLHLDLIRSLSWIEHPHALQCLHQVLQTTENLSLAQETVALLGRLAATSLHPLANQILLEALSDNHPVLKAPEVRRAIAYSLGQLHQLDALQPLTFLLLDSDRTVQLHALAALKNWPLDMIKRAIDGLQKQVQMSPSLESDLDQLLMESK